MAIHSDNFCLSCVESMKLFIQNPMKFGLLSSLGGIFVFIGKVFVCGVTGLVGYFVISNDSAMMSQLNSVLFVTIVFGVIGYIIASLFY